LAVNEKKVQVVCDFRKTYCLNLNKAAPTGWYYCVSHSLKTFTQKPTPSERCKPDLFLTRNGLLFFEQKVCPTRAEEEKTRKKTKKTVKIEIFSKPIKAGQGAYRNAQFSCQSKRDDPFGVVSFALA
jgi:hypothetical protein